MSIQNINIGTLPGDNTGDILRDSFGKVNASMDYLNEAINKLNAALEDFEGAEPGDMVNGISVYDPSATYTPGVHFVVFHNNKVYAFISASAVTNIEPGTNASVWNEIPWSMLSHQRNRDSKIANYPAVFNIAESGEWNIHTEANLDKNIFILNDPSGTGTKTITFPILGKIAVRPHKIKHKVIIYVSKYDDSTYVFPEGDGFKTPKGEDVVLTKGHWMTIEFMESSEELTDGTVIEGVHAVTSTSNLSTYLDLPEETADLTALLSQIALTKGAILYVDSVYGDNDNGERGASNKPFETINMALSVAEAGDMVYVKRGNHIANYILVDGIDIVCEPGCDIRGASVLSSPSTSGAFPIRANIYGYPDIEGTSRGMYILNKSNSIMYLELGSVICENDNGIRIQDCEDVNIEINVRGRCSGSLSPIVITGTTSGKIHGFINELEITSTIEAGPNALIRVGNGNATNPLYFDLKVNKLINSDPENRRYWTILYTQENAISNIEVKEPHVNPTVFGSNTYGVEQKYGDLTLTGHFETINAYAYGCSYIGSPGKFVLTKGSVLKSQNIRAVSISRPGGQYYIHGEVVTGDHESAVSILAAGIAMYLTGNIFNQRTVGSVAYGITTNQATFDLTIDGGLIDSRDFSIFSSTRIDVRVKRDFHFKKEPSILVVLFSEYSQFPSQSVISGVIDIDLTSEAGTEHNYNIPSNYAGYTLRIIANESDEVTVYPDNNLPLKTPTSILMDYAGILKFKSYFPLTIYGKQVEPINVRDGGWFADVAAYTFILPEFTSEEELAPDRAEFQTTGNYVSIEGLSTGELVVVIASSEINDDASEFMAYLALNPISIGAKLVIDGGWETDQIIKVADNLIRVI